MSAEAAPTAGASRPRRHAEARDRRGGRGTDGSGGARPDLRRRTETAGDELARLAAAADLPPESDQLLAQAWARVKRLAVALRRQSEELELERRRTSALRTELRRLRGELQRLRAPAAGPGAADES